MTHTGLRIARMQPLHHGHIDAIQQALECGIDRLMIGIGSSNISHTIDNPLNVEERIRILQTAIHHYALQQCVEIYSIPDFSIDAERVEYIQKQLPGFDTIVSNNPWVVDLFEQQGKNSIQPIERIMIRASDIRQAIRDNDIPILEQYLLPDTLDYIYQQDIIRRLCI